MVPMKVPPKVAASLIETAREPYREGDPKRIRLGPSGAALVLRHALKARYPGVKFWVRSKDYAGGGSVDVYYDGGAGLGNVWAPGAKPPAGAPDVRDVRDFILGLGSRHFDGYIDMAYDSESYLLPDGSIVFGGTRGTERSRGSVPAEHVERPAGAYSISTYAMLFVSNGVPYEAPEAVKKAAIKNAGGNGIPGMSVEAL